MSKTKLDRRIQYSQKVIKESFIQLLMEKNITKITIKELCEKADVNRATFYAYYKDQYDLLQKIEEELMAGIDQYLFSENMSLLTPDATKTLIEILNYIQKNNTICRILLNQGVDLHFQNALIGYMTRQHFLPNWKHDNISIEDNEYIFLYLASGCIGILKKWLEDDCEKPAKEIAQLIQQLSIHGRTAFTP